MKKVFALLLAATMVFSLAACGSSKSDSKSDSSEKKEEAKEDSGDKVKIGFAPYTLTNEYFSAVLNGVQEACDELGYELVYNDPQSDSTTQAQQVDDMIAQGISGLVYIPNDSANARSVLQACKDAGVFVINVDNVIKEDDYELCDGIIASDNEGLGRLSGEWVAKNHPDGANILIAHLQTAESCVVNVDGFWKGIKENVKDDSKFKEVQVVEGGGATDVTYKAVSDALSAHPDIDVIYCINDTSALGAIQAVEDAGLTGKVDILGKDAAPNGKKAISEGKMVQSSGQCPSQMGYDGVYEISELLAGNKIEFNVAIDAYNVDKDNIDDYDLDAWDEITHKNK
ncbi:MAG: substrate-binding domain-containing protein [Lachnospiraceae bacterium]|nr:substrate-binding domain-containing protein [Lachnospiraceae bacterium]